MGNIVNKYKVNELTLSETFLNLDDEEFKRVTGCTPYEWRKNPENFEQQIMKFEIHPENGW